MTPTPADPLGERADPPRRIQLSTRIDQTDVDSELQGVCAKRRRRFLKTARSTKYSRLFIVLTFVVFFSAEVLCRTRVHPIQYTMAGAGLCVFFRLLLALSEHVGFNTAYLLASTGGIGLVTGYSTIILDDAAPTIVIGASLLAMYVFLFTVLQLERYALFVGSLGLFGVLAIAMLLSRHVDWHRSMSRDGDV